MRRSFVLGLTLNRLGHGVRKVKSLLPERGNIFYVEGPFVGWETFPDEGGKTLGGGGLEGYLILKRGGGGEGILSVLCSEKKGSVFPGANPGE